MKVLALHYTSNHVEKPPTKIQLKVLQGLDIAVLKIIIFHFFSYILEIKSSLSLKGSKVPLLFMTLHERLLRHMSYDAVFCKGFR